LTYFDPVRFIEPSSGAWLKKQDFRRLVATDWRIAARACARQTPLASAHREL